MARFSHIHLPDGSRLDFPILVSGRRKTVGLKLTAQDGLVVTVPPGLDDGRVTAMVGQKAGWIAKKLQDLAKARERMETTLSSRPETFELPALAESWRVDYRKTFDTGVNARTERAGTILVWGAVDDAGLCQAVLRRWLAQRAKDALGIRLTALSTETGIEFRKLTTRSQRTRWGSCSSAGGISLNCALLFLPPECARYVMIHELCHMLEPNHSKRFWALVGRYEPRHEAIRRGMRDMAKRIPGWASPWRPAGE